MGIDISTKSTGWGVIDMDSNKLLEFGKINPTGSMTSAQKMLYFHNELERIISRQFPDEIAIEDVVQVKSVSVTKILSRFNGIAIVEAYRHLERDPILFEPTEWKKIVVGFGGAKKCETQLFVCEKFGLLSKEKIESYKTRINDVKSQLDENNDSKKINLKDLNKKLKKCDDTEIENIKKQIKTAKEQNNSSRKKNKKDASKLFEDISMSIYTESSINEDIGDSICVALALQKSLC